MLSCYSQNGFYSALSWHDLRNDYYVSHSVIEFHTVACGIDSRWSPICLNLIWHRRQMQENSNSMTSLFPLMVPVLFSTTSVLSDGCTPARSAHSKPPEKTIDISVTVYYVVSSAPHCQSDCWSNLLKLHELWLAISTIMYPPCIIHSLCSFWLSPGENMRGESHPAPTKPGGLVLWWERKKINVAFLIIQTLDDL